MSDTPLRSLASETSDPLARELLESARADGPERGARDRALLGLGLAPVGLLGAALSPTASAAGAPVGTAGKGGLLLLGKSLAIGLLGSLLGLGVLATRGEQARAPARATIAVPVATAAVTTGPTGTAVPEPTVEPPTAAATAVALRASRARSLDPRDTESVADASSHAATEPAPSPSVARHSAAAAQLAALAGVRSALAAHQPTRALSLLDDFERRFPGSQVAEEAAVLRIEALSALGRGPEARAMGLRFLRDKPGSVYGARVRAVTQFAAQSR